jgi:hypothetical protein
MYVPYVQSTVCMSLKHIKGKVVTLFIKLFKDFFTFLSEERWTPDMKYVTYSLSVQLRLTSSNRHRHVSRVFWDGS